MICNYDQQVARIRPTLFCPSQPQFYDTSMAPLLTEEESALDPYLVLELAVGATEKEIKKAYRQLSLRYHPDKNQTPEAGTSPHPVYHHFQAGMLTHTVVKFRQIQLSNDILNDAAKRTYVDTKLEADRRRKEKYAASDKRKQEMIDVSTYVFPASLMML